MLGDWGCDEGSPWPGVGTGGAISGSDGVDPCAMAPGDSVSRTYYVRNVSTHTGLYEVGIGEFELTPLAEFAVGSGIEGATTAGAPVSNSAEFPVYGAGTGQADLTPAPFSRLASIRLAPGAVVKVVDTVSIPEDVTSYEPEQRFSPRMWVGFTAVDEVDTDRDGLPDQVEGEIGTDPFNPYNPLPSGTVGKQYRPQPFLPTVPEGATVTVDETTLPPGITLEDGELSGRPTRAGVYDIEFTLTLPDGAEYTSIRRLVVYPAGGFWPIVVGGVVGVIVGILGPGLGAALGSVGGLAGGSVGGSVGGIIGSIDGLGAGSGLGSIGGSVEGSVGGSLSGSVAGSIGATVTGWFNWAVAAVTGALGSDNGDPGGTPDGGTPGGGTPGGGTPGGGTSAGGTQEGGPGAVVDGAGPGDSTVPTATGQIPVERVTPPGTSPSDEWSRANAEVRSSLPTTGVEVADLLLWALTAAAAGATLLLLAKRRRDRTAEN